MGLTLKTCNVIRYTNPVDLLVPSLLAIADPTSRGVKRGPVPARRAGEKVGGSPRPETESS